MNKPTFLDSIRQKYIDEFLESSKKINYTDLNENDGLIKILYKNLPKHTVYGYPVASDYVGPNGESYNIEQFNRLTPREQHKCELRYYFLPKYHELYVGGTGSGKTTGCVEPQLRAISSQKNKPNLFLTDPKGEIYEHNVEHLVKNGYQVYILNFKETMYSNRWNPLLELYELKQISDNLENTIKMHYGPIPENLVMYGPKDQFVNDTYLECDGKAFPNGEVLNSYISYEKDFYESKIDSTINQLSNMFIKISQGKDSSWEAGAQNAFKGILHCMIEDSSDKTSGFTKDMMTIKTIYEYYQFIKARSRSNSNTCVLCSDKIIQSKSPKARHLLETVFTNATVTMGGFCGVFDSSTKDWFQAHIYSLTTGQDIDVTNNDKPFAIFLITRDYEKSDFIVAGLFIDWVYRKMIENIEKNGKGRTMHFILDEFGNIPEIKDLENKIATARSRDIWFHLIVQSYKQIDFIYGEERSTIIRDNCNSQIFLGAQNMETKIIFSKQCGTHYVPTLKSKLDNTINDIFETPLVPVSNLDLIKPGQMFNKRIYSPVITTQFVRSYEAANHGDFNDFYNRNYHDFAPFNTEPFSSERYNFSRIKDISNEDDDDDIDSLF